MKKQGLDPKIAEELTVSITLDRERKLYFGMNAVHAFRAHHQKNIFRVIDKDLVQTDDDGQTYVDPVCLTALLHVGLIEDDRAITRERVAQLVHESCVASGAGYQTHALALATVVWEAFIKAKLVTPSQAGHLFAKAPDIAAWLMLRNGHPVDAANFVRTLFAAAVADDTEGAVKALLERAGFTPAAVEDVLAHVSAGAPDPVDGDKEEQDDQRPDPTPAADAPAA